VTLSLAVVCEARADCETGCGLADRVFLAAVDWLDDETLPHCRQWRGFEASEPYLLWKHVKPLARSHSIRAHGHFDGWHGAPDAHVARLALLLIHASPQPAQAVVLLRDDDRQTDRRQGLEQARNSSRIGVPVVVGLAHPKRECWVLAGFEPQDKLETDRVAELRSNLGFDPRECAVRLTARKTGEPRNAKDVLDLLTGGDWHRQAGCWEQADLALLEKRGEDTGLNAYLREVRGRLVRLFGAPPRSP
jgi:hypothetical protein